MNIIKKIHLAYKHPILNYRKEEYKLYFCENNSKKIIWLNEKDFKKLNKYFMKRIKKNVKRM
jgi:hypothetical protein